MIPESILAIDLPRYIHPNGRANMGGAPIGAGGHDPPLLEAKGTGDIIWG